MIINTFGEDLVQIIKDLLETMEMRDKRESGEFHIPPSCAKAIWDESKQNARDFLKGEIDKGGKFERIDGSSKYTPDAKMKFHGPVNGMIYMGGGNFATAICDYLRERLNEGFSRLSGAQQNGLQGCREDGKFIEDVAREIVLALTGKDIVFQEEGDELL